MKRYNKFYNVSLGNFLKVACCSLSIITIASCEEEPFEQESNSESELLQAASALRTALGNSSNSGISIADLENITSLDPQKAQNLCENLEKIKKDESITDKVKGLAANLWSKCKSFFSFKKEENKPTDDKSSQAEPELNIAEEWKKVEDAVNNLITKYESLGTSNGYCNTLDSIKGLGNVLNDVAVVCANLKDWGKNFDSDKKDFKDNQDVLDLIKKVESEIDAFIDKFDKSEQAGGSPSQKEQKLNKAEEWKKVDDAAQKLIQKFNDLGYTTPSDKALLKSMLEVGENLCANDSDSELGNLKSALGCIVSYKQEEKFKNHKDVIDLFDKVESEIKAFIKKFDKSEPAGDSKVSK